MTVIIPTLQEERHLADTLSTVVGQTVVPSEVLVVDGGSTDRTREVARSFPGVRVLDNPDRIQSAAMNVGLAEARGDVVVRVDGHCRLAPDYVERCLASLEATGAAMVGGAMTPVAAGPKPAAVAAAMASPLGAGPARFHVGGPAGWVDTVYLGAYRTAQAREVGGYATDVGVNEDAEFAHRMSALGGIWFDPSIRSTYQPRESVRSVARQFWRYGRSRAMTVRRHPGSLSARQLVAPALVVGLASPLRRPLAAAYAGVVVAEVGRQVAAHGTDGLWVGAVLPTMHLAWGAGLVVGLVGVPPPAAIRPATSRPATS